MTELEVIQAARELLKTNPRQAIYNVRHLRSTREAGLESKCYHMLFITHPVSATQAAWVLDKVEAVAKALVTAGDGEAGDED